MKFHNVRSTGHSIYGTVTYFEEVSFVLKKKVNLKCNIFCQFIIYVVSNVVIEM